MIQVVRRFGAARVFAAANIVVAAVIAFAVFGVLPVRSGWVVVPAFGLLALLAASTAGLALRMSWAPAVTRVAALALFWVGLFAAGTLALGMVFSRAVSGAAAWPSAGVFALSLLVVLPYTVVYGLVLLEWLPARPAPRAAAAAPVASAPAAENTEGATP